MRRHLHHPRSSVFPHSLPAVPTVRHGLQEWTEPHRWAPARSILPLSAIPSRLDQATTLYIPLEWAPTVYLELLIMLSDLQTLRRSPLVVQMDPLPSVDRQVRKLLTLGISAPRVSEGLAPLRRNHPPRSTSTPIPGKVEGELCLLRPHCVFLHHSLLLIATSTVGHKDLSSFAFILPHSLFYHHCHIQSISYIDNTLLLNSVGYHMATR